MDLQPRTRFQENKAYVSAHKELVVSDQFRAACEAALAQITVGLPETDDPAEAAANWHRVEGARAFLKTLLNVAESAPLSPAKPTENLTR
jgi:hypothetical protein